MRTITTTTRKADAAHQAVPEDVTIPSRLRAGRIGDLTVVGERHDIHDVDALLAAVTTSDTLGEIEAGLRTAAGLLADGTVNADDHDTTIDAAAAVLQRLDSQGLLPAGARVAILRDANALDAHPARTRVGRARLAWRLLDEADTLHVGCHDTLTIGFTELRIDAHGPAISAWQLSPTEFADRLNAALADSPQQQIDELRTLHWLDAHIDTARTAGNLRLADHLAGIRQQVTAPSGAVAIAA
jgi:hypothetical protein